MGFFADIEEAARQEARQGRRENTEPHQPEKQVPAETGTEHAAAPAPRPEPGAAPPKAAAPAPVPAPQITEAIGQDDVAAASVQRIQEEIERITRRNMKDCVAAHLAQLCAGDPALARNVLSPQKSLAKCFRYISRKAREYAEQERADSNVTESGIYGYGVPDSTVYQWAVDYFNDPNADKEPVGMQIQHTAAVKQGKAVTRPTAPIQPNKVPAPAGETYEQMSLLGGDGR